MSLVEQGKALRDKEAADLYTKRLEKDKVYQQRAVDLFDRLMDECLGIKDARGTLQFSANQLLIREMADGSYHSPKLDRFSVITSYQELSFGVESKLERDFTPNEYGNLYLIERCSVCGKWAKLSSEFNRWMFVNRPDVADKERRRVIDANLKKLAQAVDEGKQHDHKCGYGFQRVVSDMDVKMVSAVLESGGRPIAKVTTEERARIGADVIKTPEQRLIDALASLLDRYRAGEL